MGRYKSARVIAELHEYPQSHEKVVKITSSTWREYKSIKLVSVEDAKEIIKVLEQFIKEKKDNE